MSAYVVEEETMNRILSGIPKQHLSVLDSIPGRTLTEKGRYLFRMNVDAVCQRYNDSPSEYAYTAAYEFTRQTGVKLAQWVKSLSCLMYQCAEGDVPEKWPEYAKLQRPSPPQSLRSSY